MTSGLRGARSCQSEDVVSEHTELDWQVLSLTDVSESVRYGYTASASTDEIGPKFLRITDIVPQCISWHSVPYCEGNERDSEKYLLQVGDIVVARTGATVGYAKQIRTPENAVFASYLVRFRINSEIAEPRFIGHLVESNVYKQYVKSQVGGAAQPNANAKVLGRFSFTLPPRRVQRRIADILSAYDDLIENNRQRIALLEQVARELYLEWFVRLRFPGHESTRIVDGVPEDWSQGRIDDLGKVVTGKTPSKKRESYYGGDVPFIKTPDMHGYTVIVATEESLSAEGANSQANKMLPSMSILVSCIGTVGAVALNAEPAQTNQQINAIVPRVDWFRYWSFFMAKTLKPLLEGMGGGATMTNVSKSKFSAIKVIVPSQLILEQFDSVVSPNIDQIEQLSAMNKLLTNARNLLLLRLMSGKVTV